LGLPAAPGNTTSRNLRWPLRITAEARRGIEVLTLAGRLGHEAAPQLEAALADAFSRCRSVVIDLALVDYISGAGLAVLDSAGRCTETGGALVLANVGEPIHIALDLAGVLSRMTIEPSLERAIDRAMTRA
jgi:anti-anti-sigma factor